jgi:hypothetical protein
MIGVDLERSLAEWVSEGLLTDAQAAAIREREARGTSGAPSRTGGGIPIVVEILGYVGGALAVGAIVILMANYWDRLGTLGHVGLPGLVSVATFAAGFLVARVEAPSARRLAQFLLFLAVAATGFASGIVVHDGSCAQAPSDPATARAQAWTSLTGFVVASIAGGVVFRLRRTALQHLAFGVAVAGACLAAGPLAESWAPSWFRGVLLVAASLAWGALSVRGRLAPANVGLAITSVGLLVGIVTAGAVGHDEVPRATLVAGLAASIGLLGASLALRRGVLLGFGAAGVVVFVPWLLSSVFGETIGVPIAVLLTGVLLVAMAVMVAFVMPRMRRRTAGEISAAADEAGR